MEKIQISTQADLEECVLKYGILPFFRNNISGFSVEEMAAPGILFGGNEFEGCWEWKGPVIRNRTAAYGKFFRKKAGFVSLELLPYFLKMRREAYPVREGSPEEMIFDIISINDSITSTDLREAIIGKPKRRSPYDLPEPADNTASGNMRFSDEISQGPVKSLSRHSLEGPLQRLQMAGRICISDFQYKQTKKGERYGWGVAVYSTPEILFNLTSSSLPAADECMERIIEAVSSRFPSATPSQLKKLLG